MKEARSFLKTRQFPVLSLFTRLTIFVAAFGFLAGTAEARVSSRSQKSPVDLGVRLEAPRKPLPRWEFRTAPVAFAAQWTTLEISYRLSRQISVGPTVVSYGCTGPGSMLSPCRKGQSFGAHANYFLRSVTSDGWYVSSHVGSEKFDSFPHGSLDHNENKGFSVSGAFGYQKRWGDLNLMLGAGFEQRQLDVVKYSRDQNGRTVQENTRDSNGTPWFEVKLGWQM